MNQIRNKGKVRERTLSYDGDAPQESGGTTSTTKQVSRIKGSRIDAKTGKGVEVVEIIDQMNDEP
jgi:hypothetical protein